MHGRITPNKKKNELFLLAFQGICEQFLRFWLYILCNLVIVDSDDQQHLQ